MSTVPPDGDGDARGARLMERWAPGMKGYVCGRLVAEVSAWHDDDGSPVTLTCSVLLLILSLPSAPV
jgi:hypothetical protein